ncbi:MAG: DUF1833 domain-containing protein [Deltaproteobacteria bacterium]|jgi:hypothetical protein|nr:DUF1833 domain-containing protein [Deltaproteobacteria bacterium]
MTQEKYIKYFLNAQAGVIRVECLEISHSAFSRVYRVERNIVGGVTVCHEDGQKAHYEYYPLQIENLGARNDLDCGLLVNLGDLGSLVAPELEAVLACDAILEKPLLTYRSYRSDDYATVMDGPRRLEIRQISYNSEGCSFEAKAQSLNINSTGELYTLDRFPSLRGFL